MSGLAATPTGGTLSPSAPSLHDTAGPFAVPNATGTSGTVDCSTPGLCDDDALAVATPAGSGSTYLMKVSVSWPNTAGDFDLYLLDHAGRQVASAAYGRVGDDLNTVVGSSTPGCPPPASHSATGRSTASTRSRTSSAARCGAVDGRAVAGVPRAEQRHVARPAGRYDGRELGLMRWR